MRLLGIDHGVKRIGLAVSDSSGTVARELLVINRKSKVEDFTRIQRIAAEQRVAALVVGLPHNPQAAEGEYTQADTVRRWVAALRTAVLLPIVLWDEQLTSVDARELSIRLRRKRTEPIDDLAARVMLQSYLDALRDGLAQLPQGSRPETPPEGGI